ncbi:OmpA/MotB domain protein [Desulfosarcina variabilis str. Montpellier]|uniref:OmpA family protein n=1 Tax=Desulfosarcina variabilis TaxID=2300 RepID=UPI003AFA6B0A
MKKNRWIFLSGLLLAFISACATPQPANISSDSPEQLVSQLEQSLTSARDNQVNVLAPGSFNDAQLSFNKAKKALDHGEKLSAIGRYVNAGNASLKKAEEIAQVSRTILGETNKAREKALKVGADKLGKPYNEVNKRYLELTKAIENDNLSYAQKNAAKVQAAFRDVEIMAIKDAALGNARQMLADAEDAKVQKIAPQAYSDALKALNEAETFVAQNPYKNESINQKAANAEFMVQRMISISESSQTFEKMEPEASALYLEELLSRVGKASGAGELRDKGIENQISTLTDAAFAVEQKNKMLEDESKGYQAQIADLKQQLAGLQGYSREQEAAKQKLAAEREFNERFNQVQSYFQADEAEVYKQGGQLVIRLRGINFPVGQATLTPDNYTLLSKVQKAIRTFDQPTVTIEGHTDSTGAKAVNQELSQKRAQAVKTYLVANNTLPEYRIRAAGYGPDRPLAPNTTAEGRAINRRIDVLIMPAKKP